MNDFKIIVENDVFVTSNKCVVDTIVYISYSDRYFPSFEWTDFTFPILEEWKYDLLKIKNSSNILTSLYFHDGPFWMEVHKNELELKIDLINDRGKRKIEGTIFCSYYEFLNILYDAIKSFIKILYENNMNEGDFASIYEQSLLSKEELKLVLKHK